MALVHTFTLCALKYNILVQAKRIPGIDSTLADALLDHQINRFKKLDPATNKIPEILPPEIWHIGRTML